MVGVVLGVCICNDTMYVMLRHIKKKKGKNKGQTTIVATVVSLLESRERCAIYNDDSKIKIQNEATVERGEIKKKEDNDAIYIFTTEAI